MSLIKKIINSDTEELSDERMLEITSYILKGLAYAHYRGVAHRDMSPMNVLISGDDTIKICDFGISKEITNNMQTT